MNARLGDASVAALATVVAVWPVTTLLATGEWLSSAILLVLLVAASGAALRLLPLRGWQVAIGQLVVAALAAGGLYGRGHLWHGLPTAQTVDVFARLIRDALTTIQSFTAPAPTTRGIILLVGCSVALVAVLVDYLAVTRRSPSLAGLPLLAAFLGSAANSGSSLHPAFFVALAMAWLVLVARQGSSLLRRWSTTTATPLTPVTDLGDQSASSLASTARSFGVMALVLALAVPLVLPHLPTRFLLAGLGRNDEASGGAGSVGFSQSLDLTRDLTSRSSVPVLAYRSSDPAPPPLRVTVSSVYRDGVWVPARQLTERVAVTDSPGVPTPTGLSDVVPRHRFVMAVDINELQPPNLAAPYPVSEGDLGGVRWGLDNESQTILVAEQPEQYAMAYWQIDPSPQMLAGSFPSPVGHVFDPRDLELDQASHQRVSALAAMVTQGLTTPYARALAIQQFLRSTGGFTYSLKLAPPARDRAGNDLGLDPLSNFLVTKQGYCVQFASAMIMMARSLGIPARIAVGFLPGHVDKGQWVVVASDAHAWPEIYLDGLGWTRFEPTPRGTPPPYATVATGGSAGGGRGLDETGKATAGRTTPKQDALERAQTELPRTPTPARVPSLADRLPHGWGLVLLALLLGLVGALVVPGAAWWARRSRLRSALTSEARVEAQWRGLTDRLADLGMPAPASRTPRQLRDHYVREAYLDADGEEALGRVLQTLERTRYAPPSTGELSIGADAQRVIRAVAPSRPRWVRLRAALWPASGQAQLRAMRRRAASAVLAPGRAVAARLRRD